MKRIVIAEDDPDTLQLLIDTLAFRGYEVFPTEDGAQAWQIIQRETPDIAILDLRMPGLSGLEICRRIRAHPTTRDVRIIVLTAYAEQAAAASRSGADAYLVKPFAPRELRRQIEALEARRSGDPPDSTQPPSWSR